MAAHRHPYIPGALIAAAGEYRRHMRDANYAKFLAATEERAARQAEIDAHQIEHDAIRPFRVARARLDELDAADRPNPLLQAVVAEMFA